MASCKLHNWKRNKELTSKSSYRDKYQNEKIVHSVKITKKIYVGGTGPATIKAKTGV